MIPGARPVAVRAAAVRIPRLIPKKPGRQPSKLSRGSAGSRRLRAGVQWPRHAGVFVMSTVTSTSGLFRPEEGTPMKRRTGRWFALAALALVALPQAARAQGFIVEMRRPMPVARTFEVREVSVDARVRDQIAEVQVSQTFHNP